MIHIHDIFICKPGNASKAAKMLKEVMGGNQNTLSQNVVAIMTDMTGQYHRVIMVSQYENLAAYEKSMESYTNPPPEMKEMMEKMRAFQEMYTGGSREIYKVW